MKPGNLKITVRKALLPRVRLQPDENPEVQLVFNSQVFATSGGSLEKSEATWPGSVQLPRVKVAEPDTDVLFLTIFASRK